MPGVHLIEHEAHCLVSVLTDCHFGNSKLTIAMGVTHCLLNSLHILVLETHSCPKEEFDVIGDGDPEGTIVRVFVVNLRLGEVSPLI